MSALAKLAIVSSTPCNTKGIYTNKGYLLNMQTGKGILAEMTPFGYQQDDEITSDIILTFTG